MNFITNLITKYDMKMNTIKINSSQDHRVRCLRGRGGFQDTSVLSVTDIIFSPPICSPLIAD